MRTLRIVNCLWNYRYPLLVLCAGLTGVALNQLGSLRVSNSLDMWYPRDDPAFLEYGRFQEQFGSDEIVVVAVSSGRGFESEEGAELVTDLTLRLFDVEGVANITSLVTVPTSLLKARHRLISDDGQTTALLVQMVAGDALESRRHMILADIATAVEEFDLPANFAGYGVIYDSLNQASTEDSALLLVAAHVVMFVLLAFFFRRIGPVVVTLLAVGVAIIWTMGLYAMLGQQINMVTMALPTLVLVIGIADCVHILRSVARQPPNLDRQTRVTTGIASVIGPCLLTSVTTGFGFLSLTMSDLPIVQSLGMFGAIGMLAAFVASVVVVTAGLSSPLAEPVATVSILDSAAVRVSALGERFPGAVIAGFTVLSCIAIVGLARIETDTFSIGYLSDQHQARLDSDFIESRLGPYAPIDYVVRAHDVLAADVLDSVQAWQKAAQEMDAIVWSWSLLDALDVHEDSKPSSLPAGNLDARLRGIRQSSQTVTNSMISGQQVLRVSFGAPMMSARSVQSLLKKLEASAIFPENVTVQPAGYAFLYTRIVERIVSSQVTGFALALALILISIAIATRSLKRTALAIPANLFPVAATLGLMGLCGIPLDVATATIATVILGLIVDDTVHILRPGHQAGDNLEASIKTAVNESGGSLAMTSLILCAGFLVMGLAEIRSLKWFGLLTSFAIVSAIFADLLLLPAIAALGNREKGPERCLQGN